LLGRLFAHKKSCCAAEPVCGCAAVCDSGCADPCGCDSGCAEPACGCAAPVCGCAAPVMSPAAPVIQPAPAVQPPPAPESASVDPSAKKVQKLRVRNASHVIRFGR
jgi:hypothetical protein